MAPAERLPQLLVEYRSGGLSLSMEELRRLFVYAWADGAAASDEDRHVLTMLRWIAPVRDVESYLVGTQTIFRAGAVEDEAIRWTLDEAVARDGANGGIVQGQVAAGDVLAHLMNAGQSVALVDPDDVSDVRAV